MKTITYISLVTPQSHGIRIELHCDRVKGDTCVTYHPSPFT